MVIKKLASACSSMLTSRKIKVHGLLGFSATTGAVFVKCLGLKQLCLDV